MATKLSQASNEKHLFQQQTNKQTRLTSFTTVRTEQLPSQTTTDRRAKPANPTNTQTQTTAILGLFAGPLKMGNWTSASSSQSETAEKPDGYQALTGNSTRDMSLAKRHPLAPSLLSMKEWNATKRQLFESKVALSRAVGKKMNLIQHYYGELTSVVLVTSRKIAERVCKAVLEVKQTTEEKASKPPDLSSMIRKIKNQRWLPPNVVAALEAMRANGNVGAHECDLTVEQHSSKPKVVVAVFTVATTVKMLATLQQNRNTSTGNKQPSGTTASSRPTSNPHRSARKHQATSKSARTTSRKNTGFNNRPKKKISTNHETVSASHNHLRKGQSKSNSAQHRKPSQKNNNRKENRKGGSRSTLAYGGAAQQEAWNNNGSKFPRKCVAHATKKGFCTRNNFHAPQSYRIDSHVRVTHPKNRRRRTGHTSTSWEHGPGTNTHPNGSHMRPESYEW
eukprot:INCI15579.2.p1 GENE.INCI15579.2~~INCI15579.2.p1  ORF type:complete len:450 (-),score=53.27 INCI15579.2:49-1398(-)